MIEFFKRIFAKFWPTKATLRVDPKSQKTDQNREHEGAYYYLGDVLAKIRSVHKMLKKLKQVDSDAYHFQGRIGARVLPSNTDFRLKKLPDSLPSTGMTYIPDGKGGHFIYFTRVEAAFDVQPFRGETYQISGAYIDGTIARAFSAHVGVRNGRAVAIREKVLEPVTLGRRRAQFYRSAWRISSHLESMWKWWNAKGHDEAFEDFVHNLFAETITAWAIPASDELQVRVRRGKAAALLNVCTKRTPYFFKDRETDLASDGKRKRIFHIVQEHTRKKSDGSTHVVKEHYRGERRFKWDGNDVTITVPGIHHKPLDCMNVGASITSNDDEIPRGMLTSKAAGKIIVKGMT